MGQSVNLHYLRETIQSHITRPALFAREDASVARRKRAVTDRVGREREPKASAGNSARAEGECGIANPRGITGGWDMARIIGGVAASHTPTIGFAYDQHKQDDPSWAPIFKAFEPVEDWFKEKKPDAVVYVFNDHVTSFFFDHYSSFTLGIGEEYPVADEGGNPRDLPAIKGDPKLAAHIATSLVTDEFDLSFFQGKPLDHGFFSPMSVLLDRPDGRGPPRSSRCRSACCSSRSRPRPAASSWARRCAARSRATQRTSTWPSSPRAACPTRCTARARASTTRSGTIVPRRDHQRPDRPHEHDPRRVRQARRLRGRRGHHVARDARRAL